MWHNSWKFPFLAPRKQPYHHSFEKWISAKFCECRRCLKEEDIFPFCQHKSFIKMPRGHFLLQRVYVQCFAINVRYILLWQIQNIFLTLHLVGERKMNIEHFSPAMIFLSYAAEPSNHDIDQFEKWKIINSFCVYNQSGIRKKLNFFWFLAIRHTLAVNLTHSSLPTFLHQPTVQQLDHFD
jgi:hypothetical protein